LDTAVSLIRTLFQSETDMGKTQRREPYNFTHCWPPRPGLGRGWKRRLSKLRRLAWKYELRTGVAYNRGLTRVESEVNWRTW